MLVFFGLSWRFFADTISLYLVPENSIEGQYNNAYHLALNQRYDDARILLEKIASRPSSEKGKIYELYGDVLYLSSGARDDVKKLYLLAREHAPSARIDEKIRILSLEENTSQEV